LKIATFRLSTDKRQSHNFPSINATYSIVDVGFDLINNTITYEK
jgi:hypothetical protein